MPSESTLHSPHSPTPSTKSTTGLSPLAFTRPEPEASAISPRPLPIGMFMPQAFYRMAVSFGATIFWLRGTSPRPAETPLGRNWVGWGFSTNSPHGHEPDIFRQLDRVSPTSLGAFPAPTLGRQARLKPPGWRRHQPSCGQQCSGAGCVGRHAQHSCTGGHPARDGMVATRSGRMRPVSGGRDGPGRRSCGCGRSRVAARPRPADPSQPPTRCPSATTPRLLAILHPVSGGRIVRAVRGQEMAIRHGKHWRAGAGHGGGGMARSQGRMTGAGWRALSGVATGREERGRHQHPASRIAPPTFRIPNLDEDRNTATVPVCIAAQAGARTEPAPRLAAGIGPGPWAVRAAGLVGSRAGWHWSRKMVVCHGESLVSHRVALGWGEVGPSSQFTLGWRALPFPRSTPCRARSLLFLSLFLFLSLPLPATPAHPLPSHTTPQICLL